MKIGGLCFGYGGLDLGVQSVLPDAELAWYAEFDKGASKIAAHRFPGVPNHGDMTKIDWAAVEPVDILTGGTPCQDLSHAGKRQGMTEGTRSNLWVQMREAIAQLRPSLVVWENVRGAYSAEAASGLVDNPRLLAGTRRRDGEPVLRALGRVLGDLSDLGYDAQWHGLRAADVGAPHGRFRVFVIAYPQGDPWRFEHGDGGTAGHSPLSTRRGAEQQHLGTPAGPAAELGEPARTPALLPSPRASDTNGAGQHGDGGMDLRTAVTMLPTPRATDGTKGGPNQRGSSGDLMLPSAVARLDLRGSKDLVGNGLVGGVLPGVDLDEGAEVLDGFGAQGDGHDATVAHDFRADLDESLTSFQLLPTPAVNDMGEGKTPEAWDEWTAKMKAAHGNGNGHGASLSIEAQRLLPTPTAVTRDRRKEDIQNRRDTRKNKGLNLDEVRPEEWGQYAAAIARWEALTRPAPPPTEAGPKGNPRLSAAFSEWMLGLPAGWVTDVPGVTRSEALKAIGNGVCPQQCAAALRILLASEVAA